MNPDRLFKEYLKEKLSGRKMDLAVFEAEVPGLYAVWVKSPCDKLGGKSPEEYFSTCTDAEELLTAALETVDEGEDPDALVNDGLTRLPSALPLLTDVLKTGKIRERRYAAFILSEREDFPAYVFAEIAFDSEEDPDLRDTVIEALKGREDIKEELFSFNDELGQEGKKTLAEIAVTLSEDERTLLLLTDIMYSGDIRFASQLASSYGDPRMVYAMQPLLPTASYADYRELASAIVCLGGEVGEERDFSDDPDYIKITGGKIKGE